MNENIDNGIIDNVAANVETLDEETQLVIAQLNKILAGGTVLNTDGISFKKIDMNTLNRTMAPAFFIFEFFRNCTN